MRLARVDTHQCIKQHRQVQLIVNALLPNRAATGQDNSKYSKYDIFQTWQFCQRFLHTAKGMGIFLEALDANPMMFVKRSIREMLQITSPSLGASLLLQPQVDNRVALVPTSPCFSLS